MYYTYYYFNQNVSSKFGICASQNFRCKGIYILEVKVH